MVMKYIEAFQAAEPPQEEPVPEPENQKRLEPTVPQTTCSSSGYRSFPVNLAGVNASLSLYEKEDIMQDVLIEFAWDPKTIPPRFTQNKVAGERALIFDAEKAEFSPDSSTLTYNYITYNLHAVYLSKASHKDWLIKNRDLNRDDLIVYYKTTNQSAPNPYIFFVIPLVEIEGGPSPNYLRGIAEPGFSASFSLYDAFPQKEDSLFVSYATCIDGYSGQASSTNILVFIAVEGVEVNKTLLAALRQLWSTSGSNNADFPATDHPFLFTFDSVRSSATSADFDNAKLMTTRTVMIVERVPLRKKTLYRDTNVAIRTDPTDAYKCVPFDPDVYVGADGNSVQVDLDKGLLLDPEKTLKQVLNERGEVITAGAESALMAGPGSAEVWVSRIVGVGFVGIMLMLVVYALFSYFKGEAGTATAAAAATIVPGLASGAAATPPAGISGWKVAGFILGAIFVFASGFLLSFFLLKG